jgi:OHCU decarboxylase
LLLNHPDLAGKEAAAGDMTESSVSEQASAGFDALSKAEMTAMSDHNAAYRQKFGFPFIIAVRMHTKDGIFFDVARRLRNDTQTEYANALQSVYAITLMRLRSLIEGSSTSNPTGS